MKDFKIVNGDISLIGGSIEEVRGADKVRQDLVNWITNDLGYNRFHNYLGSLLDNYVGQLSNEPALHDIRQDTRRCLKDYQQVQLADLKDRIDAHSDPLMAIGLAEPDSIVKQYGDIKTNIEVGGVRVHVNFSTFVDEQSIVSFVLKN